VHTHVQLVTDTMGSVQCGQELLLNDGRNEWW